MNKTKPKKLEMVDLTLRLKSLVSSISIVLLVGACTFPEPSLPSKTHEGKNTYGYQLVLSDNEYLLNGISNVEENIVMDSVSNLNFNFSNIKNGLYYDQKFDLSIVLDSDFTFDKSFLEYNYRYYAIDSTQLNYCEVTYLDTSKRIVSGFFAFNLVDSDSSYSAIDSLWVYYNVDSVQIKKGRFDLRY